MIIINLQRKGLEVSLKNENVINRITDEIQELKKLKKVNFFLKYTFINFFCII